jgi:hypothetical protein
MGIEQERIVLDENLNKNYWKAMDLKLGNEIDFFSRVVLRYFTQTWRNNSF